MSNQRYSEGSQQYQFFKPGIWTWKNKLYVVYNIKFKQNDILELLLPAMPHRHFVNCDFSGLSMGVLNSLKGKFTHCYFVGTQFLGCRFAGDYDMCNFSDARFDGVTFNSPFVENSRFNRTDFLSVSGLYSTKFLSSCKLEAARGIKVSGPFTDSGVLEIFGDISYKPSNAVPKAIKIEKTDKIHWTDRYHTDSTLDSKSSIKDRLNMLKRRHNCVLICSKEGMV